MAGRKPSPFRKRRAGRAPRKKTREKTSKSLQLGIAAAVVLVCAIEAVVVLNLASRKDSEREGDEESVAEAPVPEAEKKSEVPMVSPFVTILDPDETETEDEVHEHPVAETELNETTRFEETRGADRVGFRLQVENFDTNLSVVTLPLMPAETVDFRITESAPESSFAVKTVDGVEVLREDERWFWTAPQNPGIYGVNIHEESSGQSMRVQVAVLKPYDGSPSIGDYRIGQYEEEPFRGSPRYERPDGFIKVTRENLDTWVSPHLQLEQFVCKQAGDFPKYMLLDPRLLVKLEMMVDSLEARGVPAEKLHLTSGFRTPWYNKVIGNSTVYSRHCYGDAADLFVDMDGDGRMDDLDSDGVLTDLDGSFLHAAAHDIGSRHDHLVGGLGFYSMDRFRNPFIHVDTRGYQARWPSGWQSRLDAGRKIMSGLGDVMASNDK